jgi:hypothetical protein
MKISGNLSKMKTVHRDPISYTLHLGNESAVVSDLLGQRIRISFGGQINCVVCGKSIKKAFGQGMCYEDFMNSPENSPCILRPELCEGHLGIGRDPEWEKAKHVQPHYVYLALTSGVKVGVTRFDNVPTRWMDQGAWKVIRFAEVPYRRLAGEIEVYLKEYITDKTNWQRMLKDERAAEVDLVEEKEALLNELPEDLGQFYSENDEVVEFNYPVLEYPAKVRSLNLDKDPVAEGELRGIRGQYLIFKGGQVINLRRFSGYWIDFES